ncbi:MAG TPA: hypothetical protein VKZ18_24485 [Polyangia bacterium]|nr:hypothetical protein [Polyangia bacterium]
MIPYEELDRALARWKAKSQGGVVDPPAAAIEMEAEAEAEAAPASGATPVVVDEVGSIPQPVASERTGEIDLAELETYDD